MSENSDGQASDETTQSIEETGTEETTPVVKRTGTNDAINRSIDEIADPDTLKSMVRTLRAENGNHRKKNRALEDENNSLKSWKIDHLKGLADAEDRVAKADGIAKRAVIKAAALEFDIDDDLLDLITGNSEEEIFERASKLANTKKRGNEARNPLEPGWVPGPTQLLPGKRGAPIRPRSNQSDDAQWLRDAWNR